ncbi:hypothetical protein HanXRQr2_Chr11g0518281 [Helianthus annuus]|uniref:PRA1 family protein n=1 Tax=Helianthus annuus TaxID=4232 RepID=A0A251TS22_HELAN|nr:hypothetical protein HanXRQr2_Chr11g0518281 [Helianthus annuus]KAJ0877384.1 hypothetical protein HanPSC8_Chr11g0499521 [Helianthus annuus]
MSMLLVLQIPQNPSLHSPSTQPFRRANPSSRGLVFGLISLLPHQSLPLLRNPFETATAIVIFMCNVQTTIIYALAVSYAVMMLHASFRKLTPIKQPTKGKPK